MTRFLLCMLINYNHNTIYTLQAYTRIIKSYKALYLTSSNYTAFNFRYVCNVKFEMYDGAL